MGRRRKKRIWRRKKTGRKDRRKNARRYERMRKGLLGRDVGE